MTTHDENRISELATPLDPQLVMARPDLTGLPPVALPDGYGLRSFRPGDESAWEGLITASFGPGNPPHDFNRSMRADPAFRPERVLFVTHGETPVATASAWYVPRYDETTGYLHMVGVLPGHRGKRLGLWISLAVLHRFVLEGFRDAVLQTDDFRLPALKTYLQLNFQPRLVHENQRARWRKVFKALGCSSEMDRRFADILAGPLQPTKDLRTDSGNG